MVTRTRMTLDQFLELPETEPPSEFVCGEVMQKPVPSPYHSLLVYKLAALFDRYLSVSGTAAGMVEPRHANRGEGRVYLPDLAVVLRGRLRREKEVLERGPLEISPDIAVEVLSPDDRPARVADKLAFYMRSGVPLVWIIDPIERTLAAYRPGEPSTYHGAADVIDAAPVLPDLRLDLGELFSVLDVGGDAEGRAGR